MVNVGSVGSRTDEVLQIKRVEAIRLLDIAGEEHFQVSGDTVNFRLTAPPEQQRETIITRRVGSGGKFKPATPTSSCNVYTLQHWMRWLKSASTISLITRETASVLFPVCAPDIESLILWLRDSGEPTAAAQCATAFEYAQNVLKLPVEC